MTVEIPPEFQQFVHQVIDAGSYTSEAAVVGEALRLLQHRQRRLEELRRDSAGVGRARSRRGSHRVGRQRVGCVFRRHQGSRRCAIGGGTGNAMKRYRLHPNADDDLVTIYEYIAATIEGQPPD